MKKFFTLFAMVAMALTMQADMYIVGSDPFGNWHTYAGQKMEDNGDGTYSLTVELSGTIWFVFADNLTPTDALTYQSMSLPLMSPFLYGKRETCPLAFTKKRSHWYVTDRRPSILRPILEFFDSTAFFPEGSSAFKGNTSIERKYKGSS